MPKLNLRKSLAIVNLIITGLLFYDTFVAAPIVKKEVFQIYTSTETRDDVNDSYWTNFVVAKSGHKYREPKYQGYSLEYEDTFFVELSAILKQPIKLIYPQSNPPTIIKSGALNESNIGISSAIFVALASALTLVNGLFFLRPNWKERIIFIATAIMLVVLFYYFF